MKEKVIYVCIAVLLVVLFLVVYLNRDNTKFHGRKNTYQTITYQDFEKLKKEDNVILVDVRSFLEYQTGHIENAKNVSLDKIMDHSNQLEKLFPDKTANYVIYCRSGNRSKMASEMLLQNGYEYVYDLGGIEDYHGPIIKENEK